MATKNRKGRIEVEVFVVLITIVITSAIILLLVKSGTLKVKDDVMPEPVLNAEFLPVGKEGSIAVKDVALCNYVDESLNCLSRQSEFGNTEPVDRKSTRLNSSHSSISYA